MYTVYYWRDKLIKDIKQFCIDNSDRMAYVTMQKRYVNPYAKDPRKVITYYNEVWKMPESFYKSMLFREEDGIPIKVRYKKVT